MSLLQECVASIVFLLHCQRLIFEFYVLQVLSTFKKLHRTRLNTFRDDFYALEGIVAFVIIYSVLVEILNDIQHAGYSDT